EVTDSLCCPPMNDLVSGFGGGGVVRAAFTSQGRDLSRRDVAGLPAGIGVGVVASSVATGGGAVIVAPNAVLLREWVVSTFGIGQCSHEPSVVLKSSSEVGW